MTGISSITVLPRYFAHGRRQVWVNVTKSSCSMKTSGGTLPKVSLQMGMRTMRSKLCVTYGKVFFSSGEMAVCVDCVRPARGRYVSDLLYRQRLAGSGSIIDIFRRNKLNCASVFAAISAYTPQNARAAVWKINYCPASGTGRAFHGDGSLIRRRRVLLLHQCCRSFSAAGICPQRACPGF